MKKINESIINNYNPKSLDLNIEINKELEEIVEKMAAQVHDTWAAGRKEEGWVYGPTKNSELKTTPCMIPYEFLSEEEKSYDRNTALTTIKTLLALGFKISK